MKLKTYCWITFSQVKLILPNKKRSDYSDLLGTDRLSVAPPPDKVSGNYLVTNDSILDLKCSVRFVSLSYSLELDIIIESAKYLCGTFTKKSVPLKNERFSLSSKHP